MLGLTACGEKSEGNTGGGTASNTSAKADDVTNTSITINKNGSITSKIVEDFGESYYDIDGLKTMIESSINEYVAANASAEVSLKKCDASKGVVKVQMEYGNYNSYAGFNGEQFFAGTIQEANQAGFDLNLNLNAVTDKSEKTSISKADLLGMGDNHIVILETANTNEGLQTDTISEIETMRVECFGEIMYVGEGVALVGKKSADVQLTGGYGIIVFK